MMLDPLETELLTHLHASLQTGRAIATAANVAGFLAERKAEPRAVAIVSLFVELGFLSPIPSPSCPAGPYLPGSPAECAFVNWSRRYGPGNERWAITGRVVIAVRPPEGAEGIPAGSDDTSYLTPQEKKIWDWCLTAQAEAQNIGIDLSVAHSTDKDLYAWIKKDPPGRLPTFDTFTKTLQHVRRKLNCQKRQRRGPIPLTRSIVSAHEIESRPADQNG